MLSCAISGKVPEEPVISIKSGYIFEKKSILCLLKKNEICPITNEKMVSSDLIPVKINKMIEPRSPSATSVSSLLRHLQNEWDVNLLETYKLRKHVTMIRQELSHALYQHDAACRVIARITQERDKART
jgi:pre-mRNA-processing factor 19